ncbi:MAG: hypothetical protein JSS57_18965 [Proteobacteria bacterium]|nr:hypothetical protein [Pseudomonadota bacterium]
MMELLGRWLRYVTPPGPPLIMKSGRTKGVTNKNGRNAAGYPPGFIELSNPVTTV